MNHRGLCVKQPKQGLELVFHVTEFEESRRVISVLALGPLDFALVSFLNGCSRVVLRLIVKVGFKIFEGLHAEAL